MSDWKRKKRKARNGEVFHEVFLGRGVAVYTDEEQRKIIEGPISARIVKSEKFGWELHFNAYTRKGGERIELRNPSEWNRIEHYIPLNEENIDEVIKRFEELLEKIKESRRRVKRD